MKRVTSVAFHMVRMLASLWLQFGVYRSQQEHGGKGRGSNHYAHIRPLTRAAYNDHRHCAGVPRSDPSHWSRLVHPSNTGNGFQSIYTRANRNAAKRRRREIRAR